MNNKLQTIIAILVLGFGYGIYDFYDYSVSEYPKMQKKEEEAARKIVALETESAKLQNFAKNIQAIKQEFRELNLQLEAVLEHMPRTFNLASLLRKLTMLAQNSGVEIIVFRPKKENTRPDPKAAANFYETISVDFSLKGAFTQTLVFFDQLARLKRIVNVDSLKMNVLKDSKVTPGMALPIASDITIRTYRFTE